MKNPLHSSPRIWLAGFVTALSFQYAVSLAQASETSRTDSNEPLPPISLASPALNPSEPLPSKVIRTENWEKSGTCSHRRVVIGGVDPVTEGNWEILVDEWLHRDPTKRINRAAIVVPPTGGVNVLDESWSKQFCKKGAHTVLIRTWTGDLETGLDPNVHDRGSLRGIAAIRQTMTFLKNHSKVSIFGTSLGAILAAMATGLEPRIDQAVFLVAGGSITEILTYSDQELLVDMRARRKKAFQLRTDTDYRQFLLERLKLEALDFAQPDANKKLTFLIGMEDTTVPTFSQIALWEAWGKPKRYDLDSAHFGSILKAWTWYSDEVIEGMGL